MSGRTVVIVALPIAAVLLTASVGIALTRPTSHEGPSSPRQRATGVDHRLTSGLATFRRARRADDDLPQRARTTLEATSTLGANVDMARRARRGPDGQEYFLVPGNDSLALVNGAGTGSIDDIDHALSGRSVSVEDCASGGTAIRVIGLLPDSAEDPRVLLSDGSTRPLDVRDNVYLILLAKSPATLPVKVTWREGGSPREAMVPVPTDILQGRCYTADG